MPRETATEKLIRMTEVERSLLADEGISSIAGIDEVGRGPLAGPVVTACVSIPLSRLVPGVDDSKKLSEKKREALYPLLLENAEYARTSWMEPSVIDEINILNASFEGMSLAVARLDPAPAFLAIDGNRFRTRLEIPWRCIVKGDGKYADIAAASVLAKTHRDEYMLCIAEEFPQYGWAKNKGYPTREHRLAIREHGLTPHHRLTFNHEIDQLELPF